MCDRFNRRTVEDACPYRGNGVSRIMEATLAKTVLLYGERRVASQNREGSVP